jgi:hypothetical protein
VNTDDKWKKRFMSGLHPGAKMQLRMLKAMDFQELVDAAITMEDDFKQVLEDRRKKARIEPRRYSDAKPTTNIKFKPKYRSGGNVTPRGTTSRNNDIVCCGCGALGHIERDCRQPKVIYFGCKKGGHMIRDCPERGQTGGRGTGGGSYRGGGFGGGKNKRPTYGNLNCTNLEEVNQFDKTVIGMLQILSHPGKVLFDTGANTSFISQEFVDLYGIPCNTLEYPITILSAGGTILVTHLRQEQVIMIRDCVYLADLFLIPMKDMDVILGMDWLEENGALIDCRDKTVSLRSLGGGRIVYQGDRHAHIEVQLQLNALKESKLEDISVVNEFQDVFP